MITEDVFVNTKYPIIRKDTELFARHIEVLKAFGVKKVKVEEQKIVKRGETYSTADEVKIDPDEVLASIPILKSDLKIQYIEAVLKYKKEYNGWCAGIRPDIAKIRSIIIPLLEKFIDQKKILLELNDFSDSKDYIFHHAISVGILAAHISKQMGLERGQILQMGLAGTLADCGMAKINPNITEKAAFLTKEEFNEVKKHAIYSYQMLQDTPLLRREMKLAIFQHHERLDGSGYPRGDKMGKIPMYSQILAVADVFHAMTSERIYRAKESPFKVIEMIKEEEFGKFDIRVVQTLYDLIGDLSIGTRVQLTNGEVGEVIFIHQDAKLRPKIKKRDDQTILDLATNRHLAIDKIV